MPCSNMHFKCKERIPAGDIGVLAPSPRLRGVPLDVGVPDNEEGVPLLRGVVLKDICRVVGSPVKYGSLSSIFVLPFA